MKLGFRSNAAKSTVRAVDLFARCEQLWAANFGLAYPGECCDYILNLASPDGGAVFEMTVYSDPDRSYGLFPSGRKAGRGSFIEPDGSFRKHGRITRGEAARILATYTPVSAR